MIITRVLDRGLLLGCVLKVVRERIQLITNWFEMSLERRARNATHWLGICLLLSLQHVFRHGVDPCR